MLTLIRGKSVILFDFILLYTAFSLNQYVFFNKLSSGGGYSGNQENRYVGFGNTVTPEKKEDDFINNAMSSIYSVRHDILAQVYLRLLDLSSPLTFLSLSFRAGAVSLWELASLLLLLKTMYVYFHAKDSVPYLCCIQFEAILHKNSKSNNMFWSSLVQTAKLANQATLKVRLISYWVTCYQYC